MTNILVIPDAHAEPGVSNARFTALGRLVAKEQPDIIVCMGDWASMDSLSSYDKGKKSHEGRRYQKDIAAANDALAKFEAGISSVNAARAEQKKKRYTPRKVLCWGNHEERIDRAVSLAAELEGTMSKDDINFKAYGWETHEYMDTVAINGVYFSHCMATGISGKPISGENPASTLLKKHYVSCVVAHSHIYDYSERTRADGAKLNGLVAGCYCDHDMDYARATQHMWWAGVTFLDDVKDGDYDLRRISLKRILAEYL